MTLGLKHHNDRLICVLRTQRGLRLPSIQITVGRGDTPAGAAVSRHNETRESRRPVTKHRAGPYQRRSVSRARRLPKGGDPSRPAAESAGPRASNAQGRAAVTDGTPTEEQGRYRAAIPTVNLKEQVTGERHASWEAQRVLLSGPVVHRPRNLSFPRRSPREQQPLTLFHPDRDIEWRHWNATDQHA